MPSSDANETSTRLGGDLDVADHTVTFLIGFGVLVLFVLAGVMASIFLCVTLKKDPFLWDAGPDPTPDAPDDKHKDADVNC